MASSSAWHQLADATAQAHLPSPASHGASVSGLSTALAALVVSLRPNIDFASAVRCTLAAVGGSMGATALALAVLPALLKHRALSHAQVTRFASAASLPLAASGWIAALPTPTMSYLALAPACALAYRSGSFGAHVFLGRPFAESTRIGALTCLVAALPSLLVAPLCALR